MSADLVIVWRLTEKCSLACPFCAYDRNLQRSRRSAEPEQVLEFGRILSAARQAAGREILVSWLGGEPFLWPALLEVSKAFKHVFGLQVAVTTNGLALSSGKVRQQLVSDFDQVTVSIDAPGPEHDQLRGSRGLFANLQENIPALCELARGWNAPLLVRVNTILMHANLSSFEPLCAQLAGWGVNEITFNILGGRDRPEFFPGHRLTREDAAWIATELPRIRGQLSLRGVNLMGSRAYLDRILQLAEDSPHPVEDCAAGRRFLFIDENGIAAPCHFTVDGYGVPIRDLHGPADLDALPSLFRERKHHTRLQPCLDCSSTQVFGKFEHALDLMKAGEDL